MSNVSKRQWLQGEGKAFKVIHQQKITEQRLYLAQQQQYQSRTSTQDIESGLNTTGSLQNFNPRDPVLLQINKNLERVKKDLIQAEKNLNRAWDKFNNAQLLKSKEQELEFKVKKQYFVQADNSSELPSLTSSDEDYKDCQENIYPTDEEFKNDNLIQSSEGQEIPSGPKPSNKIEEEQVIHQSHNAEGTYDYPLQSSSQGRRLDIPKPSPLVPPILIPSHSIEEIKTPLHPMIDINSNENGQNLKISKKTLNLQKKQKKIQELRVALAKKIHLVDDTSIFAASLPFPRKWSLPPMKYQNIHQEVTVVDQTLYGIASEGIIKTYLPMSQQPAPMHYCLYDIPYYDPNSMIFISNVTDNNGEYQHEAHQLVDIQSSVGALTCFAIPLIALSNGMDMAMKKIKNTWHLVNQVRSNHQQELIMEDFEQIFSWIDLTTLFNQAQEHITEQMKIIHMQKHQKDKRIKTSPYIEQVNDRAKLMERFTNAIMDLQSFTNKGQPQKVAHEMILRDIYGLLPINMDPQIFHPHLLNVNIHELQQSPNETSGTQIKALDSCKILYHASLCLGVIGIKSAMDFQDTRFKTIRYVAPLIEEWSQHVLSVSSEGVMEKHTQNYRNCQLLQINSKHDLALPDNYVWSNRIELNPDKYLIPSFHFAEYNDQGKIMLPRELTTEKDMPYSIDRIKSVTNGVIANYSEFEILVTEQQDNVSPRKMDSANQDVNNPNNLVNQEGRNKNNKGVQKDRDFNSPLSRYYMQISEGNKQMTKAKGHICKYLETVVVTQENYTTVTEPEIMSRIRIIGKCTKPRDKYENTYEFPHLMPDLIDKQIEVMAKALKISEKREIQYMSEILTTGKLPISGIKNASNFMFRGMKTAIYCHPFTRAVADICWLDMINRSLKETFFEELDDDVKSQVQGIDTIIIDVGSKAKKISNFIPEEYRNKVHIICIKPELLSTDMEHKNKILTYNQKEELRNNKTVYIQASQPNEEKPIDNTAEIGPQTKEKAKEPPTFTINYNRNRDKNYDKNLNPTDIEIKDMILDSKISVYDILAKSAHQLASTGAKCENGRWSGGLKLNEMSKASIMTLIKQRALRVLVYCVDSHYYPGVKGFCNVQDPWHRIYCVSQAYPKIQKHQTRIIGDIYTKSGTPSEGRFKVERVNDQQIVTNCMNENYGDYVHERLPLDPYHLMSVSMDDRYLQVMGSLSIAHNVSTVIYEVVDFKSNIHTKRYSKKTSIFGSLKPDETYSKFESYQKYSEGEKMSNSKSITLYPQDTLIQAALYQYTCENPGIMDNKDKKHKFELTVAWVQSNLANKNDMSMQFLAFRIGQLWPDIVHEVLNISADNELSNICRLAAETYELEKFRDIENYSDIPEAVLPEDLQCSFVIQTFKKVVPFAEVIGKAFVRMLDSDDTYRILQIVMFVIFVWLLVYGMFSWIVSTHIGGHIYNFCNNFLHAIGMYSGIWSNFDPIGTIVEKINSYIPEEHRFTDPASFIVKNTAIFFYSEAIELFLFLCYLILCAIRQFGMRMQKRIKKQFTNKLFDHLCSLTQNKIVLIGLNRERCTRIAKILYPSIKISTPGNTYDIEGEVQICLTKDKVYPTLLGGCDIPTSIEQYNKQISEQTTKMANQLKSALMKKVDEKPSESYPILQTDFISKNPNEGIFQDYCESKNKLNKGEEYETQMATDIKYYSIQGKQITRDECIEEAKQRDEKSKSNKKYYLPSFQVQDPANGKTLAGVDLKFIKQTDSNQMKTIHSRPWGNQNKPDPLILEDYYKFLRPEVRLLISKLEKLTSIIEPLNEDEYIGQLKKQSQKSRYKRIQARQKTSNKIEKRLTMELKKHEQQFVADGEVRGRIVISPPETVVVYLGVVNHYFLRLLKHIYPNEFVSCLNLGETCDRFTANVGIVQQACDGNDKAYCLSIDNSEHDASQYEEIMKEVDVPIIKFLIKKVGAKLGWDMALIKNLTKMVASTRFSLVSYWKGTRKKMLTATSKGGVLSGMGNQTTAGNTVREILKGLWIKSKLGLPHLSRKFMTMNAGDDAVFILSEEFLRPGPNGEPSQLQKILEKLACTDKDETPHGLGWKVKPGDGGKIFKVSRYLANFCSKELICQAGHTNISRMVPRILYSALVTPNLTDQLTPAEFNYCNTESLKAGHTFHPIIQEIIEYREKNLPHRKTKKTLNTYAYLFNLNSNTKYDTPTYGQYLYKYASPNEEVWLNTVNTGFEWSEFYRQKIAPNLTYTTSDKYSFDLKRNYEPISLTDPQLLESTREPQNTGFVKHNLLGGENLFHTQQILQQQQPQKQNQQNQNNPHNMSEKKEVKRMRKDLRKINNETSSYRSKRSKSNRSRSRSKPKRTKKEERKPTKQNTKNNSWYSGKYTKKRREQPMRDADFQYAEWLPQYSGRLRDQPDSVQSSQTEQSENMKNNPTCLKQNSVKFRKSQDKQATHQLVDGLPINRAYLKLVQNYTKRTDYGSKGYTSLRQQEFAKLRESNSTSQLMAPTQPTAHLVTTPNVILPQNRVSNLGGELTCTGVKQYFNNITKNNNKSLGLLGSHHDIMPMDAQNTFTHGAHYGPSGFREFESSEDLFSEHNKFQIARQFPASINARAIGPGGEIIPSPTFCSSVGCMIHQSPCLTKSASGVGWKIGYNVPLGSTQEVEAGYGVPTVCVLVMSAGASLFNNEAGVQNSGLGVIQFATGGSASTGASTLTYPFLNQHYFNAGGASAFGRLSLIDLIGSDYKSIGRKGGMFAMEMAANFVAPQALIAGNAYFGTVTMAQLASTNNIGIGQPGMSVNDLISIAKQQNVGQNKTFCLKNSITNTNLFTQAGTGNQKSFGTPTGDQIDDGVTGADYGQELLSYVVLVNPIQALGINDAVDSQGNREYQLQCRLMANNILYQNPKAFANSIFSDTSAGQQNSIFEHQLKHQLVEMNPQNNSSEAFQETFGQTADIRNMENPSEVETASFMEKAMALLSEGSEFVSNLPLEDIMQGASTVASLLLTGQTRPKPSEYYKIDTTDVEKFSPKIIQYEQSRIIQPLRDLTTMVPNFQIQTKRESKTSSFSMKEILDGFIEAYYSISDVGYFPNDWDGVTVIDDYYKPYANKADYEKYCPTSDEKDVNDEKHQASESSESYCKIKTGTKDGLHRTEKPANESGYNKRQ